MSGPARARPGAGDGCRERTPGDIGPGRFADMGQAGRVCVGRVQEVFSEAFEVIQPGPAAQPGHTPGSVRLPLAEPGEGTVKGLAYCVLSAVNVSGAARARGVVLGANP